MTVLLRDRDANPARRPSASQADGTLEERVYYVQNWRADVVALMTSAGALISQARYDPYGVPFGIAKTDLDADGDVDSADYTLFTTYWNAATMPFADWNWDGTKNTLDQLAYLNDKNADAGLGRGVPAYPAWSHAGAANRRAYAGYEIDPALTGSEGWQSIYHVRNRVYLSQLGRWTRRDPMGYVDGLTAYGYAIPLVTTDSQGLRKEKCPGGDCVGDLEPIPCDNPSECKEQELDVDGSGHAPPAITWTLGCARCADELNNNNTDVMGALIAAAFMECLGEDYHWEVPCGNYQYGDHSLPCECMGITHSFTKYCGPAGPTYVCITPEDIGIPDCPDCNICASFKWVRVRMTRTEGNCYFYPEHWV